MSSDYERRRSEREARRAAAASGRGRGAAYAQDPAATTSPRRQAARRPAISSVPLSSARPTSRPGSAPSGGASRQPAYTDGRRATARSGSVGGGRGARQGAQRASGRGPADALQAAGRAARAVGRGLAALLALLWRVAVALWHALLAVLRVLVPLCRRYPKPALACVGAVAVAIAVAVARGEIAASQKAAYDAAVYAGAQQEAQALASAVVQRAEQVVEPASTPRDQWAQGQMPYLYQIDPQWSHESYSNGRLRHQGCGPTALAMVYVELTGKTDMDPAAMCEFATKAGYSTDQDGTSWSIMTDGAAQLGLTGTQLSVSEARLRSELEAGRPVICIMNPGHFTSSGHYIAIEKLDDEGKAVVHDSNSWVRSQKTWDLSVIASEAASAWSFTVS